MKCSINGCKCQDNIVNVFEEGLDYPEKMKEQIVLKNEGELDDDLMGQLSDENTCLCENHLEEINEIVQSQAYLDNLSSEEKEGWSDILEKNNN